MSDIDSLMTLIRDTSENIETADIQISGLSPEFQPLGQAICRMMRQGQEIMRFTACLADGDLDAEVPPRSNYMAGPVKDLYYKLKHLEWQTKQVAAGDYSQRVDFLGSFSDAFNSMTAQLKQREETILAQAEAQVAAANREKQTMKRQMELQYAGYQAYREYTESFMRFRTEYKTMMGEVYALFQQEKYEEGRQLIAQINDRMGSDVSIRRDYSNHEYINAALTDIASFCKKRDVALSAMVHIPEDFFARADVSERLIDSLSELVYYLLALTESPGRALKVRSSYKSVWLSIIARCTVPHALLPEPWPPEIARCTEAIDSLAQEGDAVFSLSRSADGHTASLLLHLPDRRTPGAPPRPSAAL